MNEWQPIESAPKDGREILTWSEIMGMAVWPSTAKWERHVTHWMPLPEPPEAAMEEGRHE